MEEPGPATSWPLHRRKPGKFGMLFYRSEDGGITRGQSRSAPHVRHEQIRRRSYERQVRGTVSSRVVRVRGHGQLDYHVGVIPVHRRRANLARVRRPRPTITHAGLGLNAVNPVLSTDGELFAPLPISVTDKPGRAAMRTATGSLSSTDGGATFSTPQRLEARGQRHERVRLSFVCRRQFQRPVPEPGLHRVARSAVSAGPRSQGGIRRYKLGQPARAAAPVVFIQIEERRGRSRGWFRRPGRAINFPWQSLAVNKDGTLRLHGIDTRDTRAGLAASSSIGTSRHPWTVARRFCRRCGSPPRHPKGAVYSKKLGRYRGRERRQPGGTASIHFSGDRSTEATIWDSRRHPMAPSTRCGKTRARASRRSGRRACASSAPRRRRLGCRKGPRPHGGGRDRSRQLADLHHDRFHSRRGGSVS